MPRATQSKESAIVSFFKTAELSIAQLLLKLIADQVRERTTKSVQAKARAAAPSKPAAAAPSTSRPAPAAAAKAKPKAKAKRKPTARTSTARQEPIYDEQDLNGDEPAGDASQRGSTE